MLKPGIIWIMVIVSILFPPSILVTVPILVLTLLEANRKAKLQRQYARWHAEQQAYAYFGGRGF